MRSIKFMDHDGTIHDGWVFENQVGIVQGDIFTEFKRDQATIPMSEIKLLPPVAPSKIICVGRNYPAHAKEHGVEVPKVPLIFLKPPSSLITNDDEIVLPPQSKQVEHEAELAVIIGKQGRWITPEQAKEMIFGYSIANDVTARDLQRTDNQWTRAKGFDTFCSLGPWIESDINPLDSLITCRVNGEMRQMGSTRDMVFSVRQLIAYISSIMTLMPGDVILTGTPAGVSPLAPGDIVEISIEGIGTLRNKVVSQKE
ncbi:MAG: fumarylacetoacetate hydrolase family protein [Anaerolineales bacterium]|nr:fumarylacetoacetate hydrolase family protein [Anaerolineales bacterium]HEY61597.1 fumarylacetoacetate hydrolase family protein [Anaerolineae bacterium]